MNETGDTGELTCPSCGAPRLAHAWDCAKCGAVFDQAGSPVNATGASSATSKGPLVAPPVTQREPRRSSTARRQPVGPVSTGGGLTALRQWVADNRAAAVILSFVVYSAVVWVFSALIIGGTNSPGAIKNAYRDLTGRPLPDGFGPTFAAHFVSRKLVVLDRPDQVVLVLYKDRDGSTDRDLLSFVEATLDLFEVPWTTVRTGTVAVAEEAIEISVFELGGEGGPHLYLVPTATVDGHRAVEAVIGAPNTVFDVVDEMVRMR